MERHAVLGSGRRVKTVRTPLRGSGYNTGRVGDGMFLHGGLGEKIFTRFYQRG